MARCNVIYTDADGTVSRASFMELETEFTHIVAETLISQFATGDWMAANHADRIAGDKTVFKTSRFTPCKCDFVNGEKPLWDIRQASPCAMRKPIPSRIITYACMCNLPVFYFPICRTLTGQCVGGLVLTPSFLISSDFGFTSIPYFQVIDDTKDAQVNLYKYQYRALQ